ncbi:hypothetical protein G8S49_01420 [Clostridium botulinum C]|uniref:Uncharacterized protein n=3 Tax=Clostridium TaxID=1485 RepID=A0A9Q4Y1B0_CLOBO|nr:MULTISPECIES: hypothetical protein [Clostridium]EGO87977.1 hypothetical protein CBCST_08494 [Clostridium botulinum C str. Stockholm]KEI16849.1 hypothetical protein Z959_08405 [Clostridium novyi B str. ATCC 27606]MCD3194234.1 hypothetical protein [Clostridium botulinum C]MCD3199137.1 hypothetical protein [Clostridium botulinum C]MCD3204612.1 hypothetical protein [Clostridium botulinum C]
MVIKLMYIANGDYYENISTTLNANEFKSKVTNGEWVQIQDNKKKIEINSEFIISYELGENDLEVI